VTEIPNSFLTAMLIGIFSMKIISVRCACWDNWLQSHHRCCRGTNLLGNTDQSWKRQFSKRELPWMRCERSLALRFKIRKKSLMRWRVAFRWTSDHH
jgi:hypothetical protein